MNNDASTCTNTFMHQYTNLNICLFDVVKCLFCLCGALFIVNYVPIDAIE